MLSTDKNGMAKLLNDLLVMRALRDAEDTASETKDRVLALAKAVQDYDRAIESCGNDPEKMSSFCSAQGDDLDSLYFNMVRAADAINPPEPQRG